MKKLLTPYIRYAVIASTMATVAFVLGGMIPHVSGIIAAIAVLIGLRPTFHASVREGVYQILAIVLGAGIALTFTVVVGTFSSFTLLGALLLCFAIAHALKLGQGTAVSIAVSIILVLGPKFDSSLIETRFFGIALGSLLAMLGSLWTRPGTPTKRTLGEIIAQSRLMSDLLMEMSGGLSNREGDISEERAADWLTRAKEIERTVIDIRASAEDVLESHRWSPLIDKEEALAVLEQVKITQATLNTVLNISRDLRSVARHEPLPQSVATHLSEALSATAEAIVEQSEAASENPAQRLALDAEDIETRTKAQAQALSHLRELNEDYPLLIGGSVLQDTAKINKILTGH